MGYGKYIYHTGGLAIIFLFLFFTSPAQMIVGEGGVVLPAVSGGVTLHNIDITTNHTLCGASSTNFPVLVSISDNTIKTQANGGYVYRSDANDLEFFSDAGHTTLLNWEIEFYDGTAGKLLAWVSLPSISASTNITFYLQCGSTSITSFQGGSAGAVWTNDGSYDLVMHLPNGSSLTANDYTSFANNATVTNCTAGTGLIDGAAQMASAGASYINVPSSTNYDGTTGTWSFWVNTTQSAAGGYTQLMSRADASSDRGITISMAQSTAQVFIQVGGVSNVIGGLTGGPALNDGSWHYVVYDFNGTSVSTLYVDGSSVATATPTGVWSYNGEAVRLGLGLDAFWQQYKGLDDEVRISNVQRGVGWIQTEYNNQIAPGNIGANNFLSYSSWH